MAEYLEFKPARCRDCYKCLRECPVKAIDVKGHQAFIIEDRCILCGHCTRVCPQNAKFVHSNKDQILKLLASNNRVVASVAPSFISCFPGVDFVSMQTALEALGFCFAEETAVGANAVTREYYRLMDREHFPNFITSACPALCRLIQNYYPKALRYLAPVDSPMIAHAKILRNRIPDARIVFIGPCIAKKREAAESGIIDGVLTFEELADLFSDRGISTDSLTPAAQILKSDQSRKANLSKGYPINTGIIHSFPQRPQGYEYMAVDGADRCVKVLENIEHLNGIFLEMNICEGACVNGPCALTTEGGYTLSAARVQEYVRQEQKDLPEDKCLEPEKLSLMSQYPRIRPHGMIPTEKEIEAILARTGKYGPQDELNCGGCGFATCRQKAWAVYNGYADVDICVPYMRERAESMSFEIIRNNPNGIVTLDTSLCILDINEKARQLFGIEEYNVKGRPAVDFFDTTEFMMALNTKTGRDCEKYFIPKTQSYIQLTIRLLGGHDVVFGVMKDITRDVNYNEKLSKVKMETLATTDDVIKKQMRVAQEIASLLGETTAETKVALLKLKQTLQEGEEA